MGKWFNIAVTGDVADVMFYNEIGGLGITAEQFVNEFNAIKVNTVNLHINSYGGEVFDAIAIFNAIKAHPADVTAKVEGIAASAATIVMLAADTVQMAANAFLMIHNSHIGVFGDAVRLRKEADTGDKVDQQMAEIYAAKMGLTVDEVRPLMNAETWYSADEALKAKLIDEVIGDAADYSSVASAVVGKFPSAPEALKRVALAHQNRLVDLAKQQTNIARSISCRVKVAKSKNSV